MTNQYKTSQQGINLISQHEGFSPLPYKDSAGLWTIGKGHKIKQGEQFTEIPEEQADELMKQDLIPVENCINESVLAPISQNQFDALVSLAYNIGVNAFKNSTLLKILNNHENYN